MKHPATVRFGYLALATAVSLVSGCGDRSTSDGSAEGTGASTSESVTEDRVEAEPAPSTTALPTEPPAPELSAPEEPSTPLDVELLVSTFRPDELVLDRTGPQHLFEVVRDADRLSALWRSTLGRGGAPAIDFTANVVIYADLGVQPAIWKYITGVSARQFAERVDVQVEVGTSGDCDRAAAESYPAAFARVPRSDLPYSVSEREDLPDCE
jgi:hypothetical protein